MNANNNELVTVSINATEENLECYVTINEKEIPCSREVYLTIKRPGRKEAMRKYRGRRPFVNGRRCQEDCSKCPHFIEGYGCTNKGDVSLNQLYEDSEFEPTSTYDIVEDALTKIRIQEMYTALQNEDQRCLDIFSLMLKEIPQREIAAELGIADGTVTYYIKKIRTKLENFR